MVALMTECLHLAGPEKILEIGTGSGYQTAILAELASSVFTMERIAPLAEQAQRHLFALGYQNIFFRVEDGSVGWPQEAPFDGILVSCAAKEPPRPLLSQLREGRSLVIPLGGPFQQTLTVFQRKGERIVSRQICSCVFVPLVGESTG
jgi:protein-L-isoaspartate(D-aspartate) O-methyltransferase